MLGSAPKGTFLGSTCRKKREATALRALIKPKSTGSGRSWSVDAGSEGDGFEAKRE
jgi:hypothetical protein